MHDLTRAICLVIHGIAGSRQQDAALKAHFTLLAKLFITAKAVLSADMAGLTEIIFIQSAVIKDILISPGSAVVLEGVSTSIIGRTFILKLNRIEVPSRSCY